MALPKALQTSDLIFSSNSTNFSSTLASLKKSTLSITNRLKSILDDAEFVTSVGDAFALPLIANERCGSWYIPPARKAESAYFKSTDGHAGQWSFSLRRLNTQVLDVIGRNDGCVIVDSTRRGKRMPDALSKTVPIWCAVLNRALFPERAEAQRIFTAPQAVGASEHAQIEERVGGWVERLRDINVDLPSLRSKIQKPLRPIWVTRDTDLTSVPSFPQSHLVVLCTASRRVSGGEVSEGGYIQGAGDDSEGWAYGLTAPLFWAHKDELLASTEEDLTDLIEELTLEPRDVSKVLPTQIEPTTWISVGLSDILDGANGSTFIPDAVIHCAEKRNDVVAEKLKSKYLHLQCQSGKLGSRDLRKELSKIDSFVTSLTPTRELFVCCPTGKDLSLGVALAIVCRFCNNEGKIVAETPKPKFDKDLIRQKMAWITTSLPTANPSRATLQAVNTYLMSSSDREEETPAALSPIDDNSPVTPPEPSSTFSLFNSLLGSWNFSRMLDSRLVTHPTGTVDGTATFTERGETQKTRQNCKELMYEEIGVFKTTTGLEFNARRKYIYRYDTTDDEISVRFVGSDGEKDDGLFVEVETVDEGSEGIRRAKSKSKHLCAADLYDASYQFNFKEGAPSPKLERWQVRYDVKGPQKDYVSNTTYERKA